MPAIVVVATAPMPTSNTPSLPVGLRIVFGEFMRSLLPQVVRSDDSGGRAVLPNRDGSQLFVAASSEIGGP